MKTDKNLTDKNVTHCSKGSSFGESIGEFSGLSNKKYCFTKQLVCFHFIGIGKTDKIFLFALTTRKLRAKSAIPLKQKAEDRKALTFCTVCTLDFLTFLSICLNYFY